MTSFSVIIGFRDRDLLRVKKALDSLEAQTCRDFELIFIDYGSDELIANQVRLLVEQYPFAQYHYSHTRGWFWNRAHALNTGIRLAKNDLLLLYDIDLIIEKDFIKKITQFDYKDKFYTFSCFYLPRNFDVAKMNDLENTGIHYEQNYVGLCAVKKEDVMNINAFDEYFMVWGGEDDDLYMRLSANGLQRIQAKAKDNLVFHQWHYAASPGKPTLWYLSMVNHLFSKPVETGDNGNWGKLIRKEERITEKMIDQTDLDCRIQVSPHSTLLAFNDFIECFHKKHAKGCFTFQQKMEVKAITLLKWRVKHKKKIEPVIQSDDVINFFQYFVGINRHLLSDYYFIQEMNSIRFYYSRK